MAFRIRVRCWILAFGLLCVCLFWNNFVYADYDDPQTQTGAGTGGAGAGFGDPAQIVSKALLCFNDKYIYRSCEESWRLNEGGNLNVPTEKTDEFCEGPCLSETNLVLSCLDNIFSNFLFYNRATIEDIKETVQAACGYGPERGNFDVAQHIQAEESRAHKASSNHVLLGLGLIVMGRGLLL